MGKIMYQTHMGVMDVVNNTGGKMTAELRIGHDQVSLPVWSVGFKNGSLYFEAFGTVDNDKLKKLTGHQPLVIVTDDGQIVATWHADLTENFKEARERGAGNTLTFHQVWNINSVTTEE